MLHVKDGKIGFECSGLHGVLLMRLGGNAKGVLAGSEFVVMLSVVAFAEPAHIERLGIIVVVSFDVPRGSADFTRAPNQCALRDRTSGEDMGAAPLWGVSGNARTGADPLFLAETFTVAISGALRAGWESFAAAVANVGWHGHPPNMRAP
jgi:hypothetical protein